MEGHGILKSIPWWEPLFEGMCYMHGMCFAMLTPMLYISVCRKICGVIRGKGFAHVPMVSCIALDQVYRTYSPSKGSKQRNEGKRLLQSTCGLTFS